MKVGTIVQVADNSGPCFLRIIKVLKASPLATAKVGDYLIGSVLQIHQRKKFKVSKGSIVRAICLRIASFFSRTDGQKLRFQYPAVVIVTRRGAPRATKIYGPIPKELREYGHIRIVSLSTKAF